MALETVLANRGNSSFSTVGSDFGSPRESVSGLSFNVRSPEFWVAVVKPGKILYEMKGVSEIVARAAMRIAAYKMPIKTQFITK